MKRIDDILEHPEFKENISRINELERDRIYCLHGMEHLLDVARIGYIINMEQQLGYCKEMIYAMALLHDIGRYIEYDLGFSHHQVGAEIALRILQDVGFSNEDRMMICQAIKSHKKQPDEAEKNLSYILYKADKLSRNCFSCKAYDSCYWEEEKKNKNIRI
ncbi:MAG: HD domain-containing protein [Lachnospiraceae bacterium]|nr:HD domain-containing protein [Lachnospiraceae bacterium]